MSGVTETPRWPRRGYAWYVVILLMVLYLCSFLDRNIITLLVEPLKRDLDLSDVEIGMLYGLAFAAFYTTLGLFAAGMADLWNRPAVIAVGVVLWSLATAACGLASNYAQLFVARMLVGVGQAALSPAAYSLIADYFPPKARLRATATYAAGLYLGIGLATLTGGLVINWVAGGGSAELPVLGSLKGWQVVFIVVGLPGVLLGVLTLASVRETARFGEAPEAGVSARSFVRFLGGPQRTLYLTHFLGFSCQVTYSYSFGAWTPSFLIREFGWTQAQTGLGLGSVTLVTAPLGVYLGSVAAQRLRRRWPRDAEIRVAFAIALIALPFAVAFPFASTATLALAAGRRNTGCLRNRADRPSLRRGLSVRVHRNAGAGADRRNAVPDQHALRHLAGGAERGDSESVPGANHRRVPVLRKSARPVAGPGGSGAADRAGFRFAGSTAPGAGDHGRLHHASRGGHIPGLRARLPPGRAEPCLVL